MNSTQVEIVQSSFAKVLPIADQAAGIFYRKLFEIAPQVRPMFKGDMTEQGAKLMSTLRVIVNGLSDLESILPAAERLAKKHVDYGVEAEHYAVVGEALLFTLATGLGEDYDAATSDAWAAAYTLLSEYMIDCAYSAAA